MFLKNIFRCISGVSSCVLFWLLLLITNGVDNFGG